EALAREGAAVTLADLDGERAQAVAAEIEEARPGAAFGAASDVSAEDDLRALLGATAERLGPVDLFFANAGVAIGGGLESTEEEWERSLRVNAMAHVRAARLLVPGWLERGEGYFVATASAAGLLTQIGNPTYAVSKHAAVAFAEWLAVTYGDRGIRVSCLCPMGVNTELLNAGFEADDASARISARTVAAAGAVLEPAEVAERTLEAVAEERFLVLPHPEVLEFFRRKGADYDRWLAGMRRLQAAVAT
ncbi:MAG: SDR family oxidoreductase, partial [Gemmatimonadaceae bacterium]